MPTEPDPAEVAAELRKVLDAVEDGRLAATARMVALVEGAVVALEELGERPIRSGRTKKGKD